MNNQIQTKCVKIKLKKNSIQKVKDWQKFILDNQEEALQTIKNENVIVEAVFLDQGDNDDHLIYFMSSPDFEYTQQVVKESKSPVDEYHQNFKKDCWEDGKHLEELISFYNIDSSID